ncbi:hypothetical protein F4776DRAFT_667131 [Hypoxylon sp. NC0597]|nr:hypothetical protein F4776DRAFT_667131 [Hypoxylon sp. NC0597]
MSAPAQAPKTIDQLQASLRLQDKSKAEALIKAHPVREAFRKYMNRCLSAGSTKKQLPDWKEVDAYLLEKRMPRTGRVAGKVLEDIVAEDCVNKPYDLLPHASMFALRIMTFLKSEEGEAYDIRLEDHAVRRHGDIQFDRCKRIMKLLGFLVNQNLEMKRNRELEKDREIQGIMKENNWI